MKTKNLISISLLATPILAFILYSKYVRTQYQEIRKHGSRSIGNITVLGADIICSFKLNGVEKTKRMSKPHKSIRNGEQYYIYYYDQIPDKFYISFTEPVIDSATFKQTVAKDVVLNGDYIFFEYQLNGKTYERYQEAISDNIDQKKMYPVFYSIKDPRIAYLIL